MEIDKAIIWLAGAAITAFLALGGWGFSKIADGVVLSGNVGARLEAQMDALTRTVEDLKQEIRQARAAALGRDEAAASMDALRERLSQHDRRIELLENRLKR